MKTLLKSTSILILVLLSSCSSTQTASNTKKKNDRFDINQTFSKVYKATQEAISAAEMKGLELESINLTFVTSNEYTVEGGFKLWVLSGNYSRTKSTAKTTTFTFEKTENVVKSLNYEKEIKKLQDYLVAVINSAKTIKDINSFGLTEFSAEIEFTVTETFEGSGEIELLPITPSIGGSKEDQISHTITLNFKRIKKEE